jgi:PKHD-type hydroxylase
MDESNLLKQNDAMVNFYFFANVFDDKEIDQIKELSKKYPIVDGNVSGAIDKSYRNSEITWIPYNNETKWIYEKCKDLAISANNNMWNFHITTVKDSLQFTEYKASQIDNNHGHYDWHMDFGGKQSSTRKLSMTIQLSDPGDYEGGDFEFMLHRNIIKAPKTKGTVIFFPSYLTHRVTKVTSGTRNSLVTWFHGPPFV